MKTKFILVAMLFALSTTSALAQQQSKPTGDISALVFGDYYWMASNHNSDLEGNNGFWIRRVYLTYDRDLSDSFSARVRLDMSSAGDFATETKLNASVKDAWLKWKKDNYQVTAGISPTPSFSFVGEVWGYRSLEKTPLDLQKMASSRDIGVSVKGTLGKENRLGYNLMFANGNSNKTELDKGKKLMLSLGYQITKALTIEGYADWNNNTAKNMDTYTLQGFLAYQTKRLNFGALYAHQANKYEAMNDDNLDIVSAFSHFELSKKVTGVLRVDHLFEGNPAGQDIDYIPFSSQAESTLLIVGTDFAVDKNVHIMPNIESVIYGKTPAGKTPSADIIPRLTLSFSL